MLLGDDFQTGGAQRPAWASPGSGQEWQQFTAQEPVITATWGTVPADRPRPAYGAAAAAGETPEERAVRTSAPTGGLWEKRPPPKKKTAIDILVDSGLVDRPPDRPPPSGGGGGGLNNMGAGLRDTLKKVDEKLKTDAAASDAAAASNPYAQYTPPPPPSGTPTWLIPAGLAALVVGYVVWKM